MTRRPLTAFALLAGLALVLGAPAALEASKWNPSPGDADLCTPWWLEAAPPEASAEALEGAFAALGGADAKARAEAADLLGRSGDRGAVDELIAALGDPNAQVRQLAARALGRIGDRRAAGPLAAALEAAGDKNLRLEAAWALGRLPGAAGAALAAALDDSSPHVRTAAACSLGKVGGESAVPALRRAAGDGDDFVRTAAAWALERLGGR